MTDPEMPDDIEAVVRRAEGIQRPFAKELASRFVHLTIMFAEDYDAATPSARSMSELVDFLDSRPELPYPDVTLTPDGDCYAEWRGVPKRKLSIEFLGSGDVRYLLSWQNTRHPDRTDRLVVTTTADALGETFGPLAPLTGLAA